MKNYLKFIYNVEVIHVRSTVIQSKVERARDGGRGFSKGSASGRLYRPMAQKKMTVELVEPFVWPEEVKNFEAWEKDSYWQTAKENMEAQRAMAPESILRPNVKQRKSIAEQAKELLEGKARWKPTWQSIPSDLRVMQGAKVPPTPKMISQSRAPAPRKVTQGSRVPPPPPPPAQSPPAPS